jgi:hypothetical protein
MAESTEPKDNDDSVVESWVGITVVILATFLGIVSVKAGNIDQQMRQKQADRNNSWAWFQARNIREGIYEATAAELSLPLPNESSEAKSARESLARQYQGRAAGQASKREEQKEAAEKAEKEYDVLSKKDDQFDLCEAAMAIGLALMGVTALTKSRALFFFALVPSVIGVGLGVAGFADIDTDVGPIRWFVQLLS